MILKYGDFEIIQTEDASSQIKVENVEGKLRISNVQNIAHKLRDTTYEYLKSLSEEYRYKDEMLKMYEYWQREFEFMPAGAKHHHVTVGGLSKHTAQVITTAIYLFELNKNILASQLNRDDIIVAGFLHDLSKVKTYRKLATKEEIDKNGGYEFVYDNRIEFLDMETWTVQQCMEFGIVMSETQMNALFFAEGGFSNWDQAKRHPKWSPLAVLISSADLYSACAIKA